MKYYVDHNNGQIKIDIEKEFYQSENLENKITVLLTNVDDPYFLSVEFLRSDNRKCTIQTADAFGEGEDTTLTEDDVTYDINNFTLTDQVLKCAGTLMFTVYINFVNSETGAVIRRGVLLNGVNNVKKTVPYSTNSLLVLDDEEEAETTVTDILDELTAINAALATKQKKLVLQSDSGLTMTDSYKLSVKGREKSGISVGTTGVVINYSYDDFQIAKTPNYDKKIMKLNYFYNTAPVNKYSVQIYDGGTPTGGSSLFADNLTVTSTSISQIGAWQVEGTKYTYTFSGQTAKCIAKNYNHEYEFSNYYATDTNMTNSYSLSLDTTDSVCKQLLQDFINLAGRKYSHFMSSVTIPTGAVVIFKPIGKVGNVIYFSCENFMCTKTEVNYTNNSVSKIVLVNIILGLVKDGNNYKVEFEVENSTGYVFTASNSKIYMPTELLKGVRATALYNSEQELLYKFLEEENDSFNHEIIRIDTEPVDGSTHLIESGGVKAAIDNLEGALDDDISALQTQVNNLSSVQNVVDIVATKSALDALTTTNFEEDDKVQVIADETHDGASTVYNWTGSAWEFVGAYGGNSYTKAQTDTLLDGKADKSTTYTKTETDTLLNGKMSSTPNNISMYTGTASGDGAIASGSGATASGMFSIAFGWGATASGSRSLAIGGTATGSESVACGTMANASGSSSIALGQGSQAKGNNQIVTGKFNIADTNSLEIVGNGAYMNPNNARVLDGDGNEYLAGDLYLDTTFTHSGGDLVSKTGTSVKTLMDNKISSAVLTDAEMETLISEVFD